MGKPKKYLVTGGLGFIGSHTVEYLINQGHQVVALDNLAIGRRKNLQTIEKNPRLTIIEKDVASGLSGIETLKDVDTCIHLAALADIVPSMQTPLKYFEANVTGTANVLEAVREYKIKRVVYAASSSCYGIPDQYPTPETADIRPEYPYALTKNLGEQLLHHWGKVYKIPVVSLRFFNVFGPRARTTGTYGAVFGVFLAQMLAKKPLTIVGDGTQTRDFTYVSDVVDAIYTAAESSVQGEIFNVGSGHTVSVNKLAEILGGPTVHIPKRPGEPDCTFADISKIKKHLGWEPKVKFEDGVKKMMGHINDWKDAPVWTPESIDDATKDWFKYLTPATKV